MKSLLACLVLLFLALHPQAASSRVTGWIDVVAVGGQISHVYVVLSETVGDDLGCPNTRVILQEGVFDNDSRRRFFAAMTMAMAAGKKVQLAVSGCSGAFPVLTATDFWFVRKD